MNIEHQKQVLDALKKAGEEGLTLSELHKIEPSRNKLRSFLSSHNDVRKGGFTRATRIFYDEGNGECWGYDRIPSSYALPQAIKNKLITGSRKLNMPQSEIIIAAVNLYLD
jgi:hypothetical protein